MTGGTAALMWLLQVQVLTIWYLTTVARHRLEPDTPFTTASLSTT